MTAFGTTPNMHTITFEYSEAGQKAALLTGKPAGKTQTLEIDPADLPKALALPEKLVSMSGEGVVTVNVPPGSLSGHDRKDRKGFGWNIKSTPCAFDTPVESAAEALDRVVALAAKWAAENDRVEAEYLAEEERMAKEAEEREEQARLAALEWAKLPASDRVREDGTIIYTPPLNRDAAMTYAPEAYEAAKRESERMLAAREAERKAKKAAELARRAEIGGVEIEISRGDRDWGVPWGATVTCGKTGGAKDSYEFEAGTYDLATETLTIKCQPGDIIAWGQKNYRKPRRTIHERRKVSKDWRLESLLKE